jgi:fructokinase
LGKVVALGELPFTARPGGAPANVAVAAARLGSEAAFVGSVGEDLFGDLILRTLEAEGVDTSAVRRCEPPTRTSIAFVEISGGERSFTFYRSDPAADELLSAEDVSEEALSWASFVNFGSIPLIKDPARSAIHRAVELAEELDVPVAFDVNLREHLWESAEAACEVVNPLLDRSQIVKLSDDEISPLLGTQRAEEAAKILLDRGVALVFVSLGPEGAFYATKNFEGEVPSFEVEVLDPTGAGDAFLAAALVCLSEGEWDEETVRKAARRGTAAGAIACTDYGAMRALPTKDELDRFVSGGG